MPNYQEIEKDLIPNLKTFKHSHSLRAEILNGYYNVWSYNTLIATVNVSNPAIQWFNDEKYSRTTSRQQSIIKRALATLNASQYTPA